jgi:hypothetical protein
MEYCDPYFRTLEISSIIQQGSFTPDGHLPVEIQVTGQCHGCDQETINIYDIPSLETSAGRHHLRFQEKPVPTR